MHCLIALTHIALACFSPQAAEDAEFIKMKRAAMSHLHKRDFQQAETCAREVIRLSEHIGRHRWHGHALLTDIYMAQGLCELAWRVHLDWPIKPGYHPYADGSLIIINVKFKGEYQVPLGDLNWLSAKADKGFTGKDWPGGNTKDTRLAHAYLARGLFPIVSEEEALYDFIEAQKLAPENALTNFLLGESHLKLGQKEKAKSYLEFASTHANGVLLETAKMKLEEARKDRVPPSDFVETKKAAKKHVHQRDFQAAEQRSRQAVQLAPRPNLRWQGQILLAEIYLAQGFDELAWQMIGEFSIKPGHHPYADASIILINLKYQGQCPAVAVDPDELSSKAARGFAGKDWPRGITKEDRLAGAYLARGLFPIVSEEEALFDFIEAQKLAPENALTNFLLGECYLRLGRKENAKPHLEFASKHAKGVLLETAKKKLEEARKEK